MADALSSNRAVVVRRRVSAALERAASRIAPSDAAGAAAPAPPVPSETAPQPAPAPPAPPEPAHHARAREEAKRIGDDWREQPYYDEVEQYMDTSWRDSVLPFLEGSDFSVVVDLAAGRGRNTRKLLEVAGKVIVTDINQENVDACRQRFAGTENIEFFVGDGLTLAPIPDASVTLVYCFDAMVHFDSDTVRSYLREFARVLVPGGRAFCHHSNLTSNPGGDLHDNPQWRNFMSEALFAHYACKEGLRVLRSKVVDWGPDPELDCYTLLERP